ncbi:hypothetical protein AOL_s00079g214 [Orbilia oligospora ATCC 24927]|uniref:Uncharacterized protein n=1 Tax=Arthrobotrys oligospora (strain ATCC 24927 / CBS 115.81 / DSM 1491) TaxID=756982 RepID=G1XDB1_ARTOA|nr:hypothetical protein AOL_s00079g214 [Orbilia oligospora ATCC 24927]EGX48993.1 hypothetical protein AOL_s00079g214 [Orbilia oligospora ATCC 24927]
MAGNMTQNQMMNLHHHLSDEVQKALVTHRQRIVRELRSEMKWSKFAEKGFGTVVVHGDLTSVKLFEVLFDISVSCTKTPTRKTPLETSVDIKKFQETMGDEFVVQEKYVFLVMRLWIVVQQLQPALEFQLFGRIEGCMTNKHATDLKYREHKMVLTNNEVTIKWFQYHTEDQGRYAVEVWYGDGDYQVEMNLKEAAKMLQLAGASRKDFLKRKKIAGEPISEGKIEIDDEGNVGEE